MLEPLIGQFSSRGMPALETETALTELASRLRLWDGHMTRTEHPGGDVSGQINLTDRTVRFGEGPPEETLPAHLPRMLAASRKAVAAGTPVVVMGECTLVPPVLAAVRERHPGVALVWIDAHGDLNTPETTPSGFIGGMPFAELLGWCFDDWRLLAGLDPPLPEERAALVGGRDLDPGERAGLDRSQVHEADDAAGALALLPPAAPLYVHVDTDVLDPSLTPDAGFPAPGGWSVERMRVEAAALAASGRVVALSICPSAPPALDAEGLAPLVDALR
ncbi:MAG TPA: arginase family protein [Gaiellales bacterium]|jgi:arginase|nr:arginase family protein [Gaiellales bacterium]